MRAAHSRISSVFFVTWILVQAHPTAWATSFYEQPFPDSVKDAPIIVRGTVGSSYADWGHERDGGKRIFTYWDFQTSEVFKGSLSGDSIRMREMGGEKDGRGMQVSGAATFNAGEDVVVFLGEQDAEGAYDVWGMMMGKFYVKKDADGQEYLTGPGIGPHSKPKEWTFDALRRLVASQADASASTTQNSSKTIAASPSPNAASAPLTTPSVSPSMAAPQLQPSDSEASSLPTGLIWVLGITALGVILFYFARKR